MSLGHKRMWFMGLVVGLALCQVSCVTKKVSIEQAEEIASSFATVRKIPPKSSSDILQLVEKAQQGQGTKADRVLLEVTREPSEDANTDEDLSHFYRRRSVSALLAGRLEQALSDAEKSLSLVSSTSKKTHRATIRNYCSLQIRLGNFASGVSAMEKALGKYVSMTNRAYLAYFHALVGNAEKARKYAEDVPRQMEKCRSDCPLPHVKYWARYAMARAEGDWVGAADYARQAVEAIRANDKSKDLLSGDGVEFMYNELVLSLVETGRYEEAENEARRYFSRLLAHYGPYNWFVTNALENVARVRLLKGRVSDAEQLFRKEIELLQAIKTPEDTLVMARARHHLGKSLAAQGRVREAAEEFHRVQTSLRGNVFLYGKMFASDADVLAILIETGSAGEALPLLESAYAHRANVAGEDDLEARLLLALKAAALQRSADEHEAEALFAQVMPLMLEQWSELDNSHRIQLNAISSSLAALSSRSANGELPRYAFHLANALKAGSVQTSINAGAARRMLPDPRARELARKEQDARLQIASLQAQLSDGMLVDAAQSDRDALNQLRNGLANLKKARSGILAELEQIAPDYIAFSRRTLPDPETIARSLEQGEAMLVFFTTNAGACTWLVDASGKIDFHYAPLTREEIGKAVADVRQSLKPAPGRSGMPRYDLDAAHLLYKELIAPFDQALKKVGRLVLVKDGPLEQIPFAILPMAADMPSETDLLFGEYRNVPWLVRRFALSVVPTPGSLAAIRAKERQAGAARRFAGFGDPIFSAGELAAVTAGQRGTASRGGTELFAFRSEVDTRAVNSADLSLLPRLPETAQELEIIAGYFGDGGGNRIFLREQATESAVKAFDFRDYSVVSFATHGLKAGVLDGLDQPALAMTVPTGAAPGEDGMLTAEEILDLDLRAELVILSACDTAAPEGGSTEVLSGLARSFFYAGGSSLLVSNWPVDSVSTVQLTSKMMELYTGSGESKAEALRRSMLALIDGPGYVDAAGKAWFSYAHPVFFGPFMLVGDGR